MSTLPRTLFKQYLEVVKSSVDYKKILGPTTDELTKDLNLSGRTCLITGANSGIGLEMTRCLSARDCNVLMACRNTYAASVVAKSVCENSHRLHFYKVNLASLKSVKSCCNHIVKDNEKIDIIIWNAAVFGIPWTLTEDGLETTFQVNYLSQFYLLMNLEHILSQDARVVIVSSESHRNITYTMQDLLVPLEEQLSLPKDKYTSIKAYNISKLCGILAMHYLGYRWLNSGKSVFSVHPGSFVNTRLCRNWWVYEALYTFMKPFSKTINQAAATPIYCATSPQLKGLSAMYFKNCQHYEESELAKDMHLSFRIHDLTRDILRDRLDIIDRVGEDVDYEDQTKDPVDDPLVSNYST